MYLNRSRYLFLLAAFFVLSSTTTSRGQAAIVALLLGDKVASENFNLSMEIGPNFSSFSSIENTAGIRSGLNFGIGGNIKLNENWYISTNAYFLARRRLELNSFTPTTSNTIINSQFENSQSTLKLSYTDLPVLFYYQTPSRRFRFGLAPQVSFLKSAEATYVNDQGTFTQDIKGEVAKVDYGAMADITCILGKAHKGRGIFIHLRYYHGLTDVFKDTYFAGDNRLSFFSLHFSLPFITDELAAKNLED